MARRPEHKAPPEIFYNEDEAKKYSQNTRIIEIQEEMSERAYELLLLPEDEKCLILDVGCGSGLSGSVLEENGHYWIGIDISKSMLDVALEREVEGELILGDMGEGMPFKAGTFDAVISVSALQWLCNADKTHHVPHKRLYQFFTTLFACLTRNARAVFQFYPENAEQIEMITSQAMRAGFYGGVVVDFPNSTKAKKYFLVLMTGGNHSLPEALGTDQDSNQVPYSSKREMTKGIRGKNPKKSRDWILQKKERRRQQGNETRADSKYTARKRTHSCSVMQRLKSDFNCALQQISKRIVSNRTYATGSRNLYETLGVPKNSTHTDIKNAYYKLSMVYHPDKNKDSTEAAQKFREITEAYEVLGNFRLKKLYDKGIIRNADDNHERHKEPRHEDVKETMANFYRAREKRSQSTASGRTSHYDFDAWTSAHYGGEFKRQQKLKQAFATKKARKEAGDMGFHHEITCVIVLVFFLVLSVGNSSQDVDKINHSKKLKDEKRPD